MHQPATPARKAIAKNAYQINITGVLCNGFEQDIGAFIDHGQHQPFDNIVIRKMSAGDASMIGLGDNQCIDQGIGRSLAIIGIAIPAKAGFAAKPASLNHLVGNLDIGSVWIAAGILATPVGKGDIKA